MPIAFVARTSVIWMPVVALAAWPGLVASSGQVASSEVFSDHISNPNVSYDLYLGKNDCGIRALYVFLSLIGHRVEYVDVERACGGKGAISVRDLAAVINGFGIDVSCIKTRIGDLHPDSFPAIEFIPPPPTAESLGSSSGHSVPVGHFNVLVSDDGEVVTSISGTTGIYARLDSDNFVRDANRLVIVRSESIRSPLSKTALVLWVVLGTLLTWRSLHWLASASSQRCTAAN